MIKAQMYRNPVNASKYRNHPCVCGNGKKMKQCHGKDYAVTKSDFEDINYMIRKTNEAVSRILKDTSNPS